MKNPSNYVDGFVFTIPQDNVAAYTKMAKEASSLWIKFGALSYFECMGDDLTAPAPMLQFSKLTKAKETDTVWFSFITFKSRAHRDQVNKKLNAHWEKEAQKNPDKYKTMPFDMKKMAYGGFKAIVKK